MIRWRMSGRRIGGRGSEMSSKAMVSFMPGVSRAGRGSLSPSGFSRAWRMASSGSFSASQRLGRVDDAGAADGQPLQAQRVTVVEQHRRGRPIDLEDEPWPAHSDSRSRSLRRSKAIFTAPRGPAAAACSSASWYRSSG